MDVKMDFTIKIDFMRIGKGPQIFPRTEYLRRLAAVKSEMGRRGIDTLVVGSPANIAYLTGYYTAEFSASLPRALVVSIHDEEPTLILRKMDAPAAIYFSFLEHGNVIGYPENLIGHPYLNGYDAVIDFIQEHGLANRGLGLELGSLLAAVTTLEKFKARLPNARIVDFTLAIDWIRIVKSDFEISYIREAAAIVDAAIMCAAEVIRPGVREADAAAEIVGTLMRGANGKPGTSIPGILLCSSPLTGTAHIPWRVDIFRYGSQINLEVGGARYGYTAALMRTYSIGAPSDRLRRLHEAELAGMEAALNTVRPGATCSDVANAFYRTIEKLGFKKESRAGYPIGIYWREPTASLRDGDMTVLMPNMIFHLMLGNWVDEDFGYVISETFRVTETGAEVLTSAPRKLFELC